MGSAAVARPQASASASAVWQAQGVSGWLPVGRGPSRAPPAVAPPGSPRARATRTWSARASHALVGLPALAAPSAIRRPRGAAPRGSDCSPRRLRHLPWDAGGEGPRHVAGDLGDLRPVATAGPRVRSHMRSAVPNRRRRPRRARTRRQGRAWRACGRAPPAG